MRIFTLTNSSLFVISAEAYENSLNASISKISWGLDEIQNILDCGPEDKISFKLENPV